MVNVKGRWVLIAGTARGIGHLTAKLMASRGANLILHGRTTEHCAKVLSEVTAMGVEAYSVAAELSDLDAVQRMLDEIDSKGTQVDIVLNNAGMQIAYRTDYFKTPLGGPYAPNAPESAIPGIAVGAFVDDKKSGRYLNAPYFAGLTLEEAVTKAESEFGSPYAR